MRIEKLFATCPKGLEQLLEEELTSLGVKQSKQTVSGVSFEAPMEIAYKICLWSRFANRILLPLATFPAPSADALYHGARKINWLEHMTIKTTFLVNFTGSSDAIKHTQFAAQKIKDAIVDKFRYKKRNRPSKEGGSLVDPMCGSGMSPAQITNR